ncbi:MAG: glycosyltransferase family 39 protein [Sedimentisphaerales bacterium]|nr:glycosyltransferase family 39 protein [Sedimentisphaerales bacterium]
MSLEKLQTFLSVYYVYLLEINFFLLIIAFIFNYKYIKAVLAEIETKPLFFLVLISITGIILVSFLNPKIHRIYYDEDIYNSIGQNIAHHKRAVMCNEGYYENNELTVVAEEYNKQPAGYPYLISVIFRIFGTNEAFTFILTNLIYGLTAIAVFMIAYLLFKDVFAGLTACLSYILIPVNLQWFNTCAVEPSTTFFASAAILAALIYIRNKKPVNLFFLITVLAFSFNFRSESFLIFFVIGLLFLLKDNEILLRREFYIYAALLLVLSSGIILHTYAMRGQSWGASGPKFSLDYFLPNLKTNSMFYFDNKYFPLLFSILGITGLFLYKNMTYVKEKVVLLSWFLAFWGIFLFFYAGTYMHDDGLSTRFSLLSYAPISIFIGLGASFLKTLPGNRVKAAGKIIIILIIFNIWLFLPFIRTQCKGESAACRMDRKYAMEFIKRLPENSIIFTHNPNMFLINKQSAIQTSSETFNPGTIERLRGRFQGGLFLHYNYWSGVAYDDYQRSFTERILNDYNCQLLEETYFNNYRYGLYKINDPKKD